MSDPRSTSYREVLAELVDVGQNAMLARGLHRVGVIVAVLLLLVGTVAVSRSTNEPGPDASLPVQVPASPTTTSAPRVSPPPTPAERAPTAPPTSDVVASPAQNGLVVPDGDGPVARAPSSSPARRRAPAPERPQPAPGDPARARFEDRFPGQATATQVASDPATTRWALLIGINDHRGRTRDNVGSRQDAEDLHRALEAYGWRPDHIVLLTDSLATRENIEQGIAWLARKSVTTAGIDSAAVFHYSGHTKQWPGKDVDGDGEITDEALWPTDNDHMTDREFAERMASVRPSRLWIDIGACEAAGYDDGLGGPGRILTMSSREDQKSYEDPSVDNSVWGHFMVDEAIRKGLADRNGDGQVTVEEAFNYAAPRASQRTEGQSRGRQDPVVRDDVPGDFSLVIPPPPAPEPAPQPTAPPDDDGCVVLCGATEVRRAGRRS